jgi:NADH-ubiquinone oxidoreductase chain 2
MIDENNSPIQLISQIKGYFYVNSFISISIAVTLFSFIGVPPIAGFFAKQMILSAALDNNLGDNGQIFLVLVAILTSVIGAAYYLNLVKEIFFYKSDYNINYSIDHITLPAYIYSNEDALSNKKESKVEKKHVEKIDFNYSSITINSGLSSTISIITLLLSLFIFVPEE